MNPAVGEPGHQRGAFFEEWVRVCADPVVDLFVAESAGPVERTLLVVHGGPDWDHSYLRDPLCGLAGRHRLLLPDLRGCGRSTCGLSDDQYTGDALVADLVALLDRKGVQAADVLGFSFGGLVAQRLALSAPQRVRRLIVASSSVTPVPHDAFAGWSERERRRAEVVAGKPDLTRVSGPELTKAWAVASVPMDVWQAEAVPGYLRCLDAVRFSGEWLRLWLDGRMPDVRPPDAARRLEQVGVPVLLLHGRQDMTFPADLAEQTARGIATASARVLENAGHMAHIDQPEAWLSCVDAFLA